MESSCWAFRRVCRSESFHSFISQFVVVNMIRRVGSGGSAATIMQVLFKMGYTGFCSCGFFRVFVDKVALNLITVVGIHRVVNDGSNGNAMNR